MTVRVRIRVRVEVRVEGSFPLMVSVECYLITAGKEP
jgi:hypothetical protein